MAAIAFEPVIIEVTGTITGVIEASKDFTVDAGCSAAIDRAIKTAVTSAITKAINTSIAVSVVSGTISVNATPAVEYALQKGLDKAIKDVIGSQGVRDIAVAMTTIPSGVVVNRLAKSALDAITPNLWVFTDPAFVGLSRLIRAIRAIEEGEKPENTDNDGCDDEDKCRFFEGPEVGDDSEDFIFFTVFKNDKYVEGEEVVSMSAQWKKLKLLVDDPIGGHFVSQLFQELFQSCADVDEKEIDSSLIVGNVKPTVKKKLVKAAYGKLVSFRNKKIYNMYGSSRDNRTSNWLKAYLALGYGESGKCYIGSEDPVCDHTKPLKGNIVGGHVWTPALKKADKNLLFFVLPICKGHNKRKIYQKPRSDGTGLLKTSSDARAVKITSTNEVVGWKEKVNHLIGSQTLMMMTAVNLNNDDGEGEDGECQDIIQPKHVNWLLDEVHKIALEFAKVPIETVSKEVTAIVLKKLNETIKSTGNDAKNWVSSEGKYIMLQSLIPLYGIYQVITRLSSLKSYAVGKFHSGTQSALSSYKQKCLDDDEQKRREQRLIEETDKVIASKKWKTRIEALKRTTVSKVPTLIKPLNNNY